jgi:hypothetical protein
MSTTKHIAHIVTDNGISVFIDGDAFQVTRDHANYDAVKHAIKNKEWDKIPELVDLDRTVKQWAHDLPGSEKGFEVKDGLVYLDGDPFSDVVSTKVLRMVKEDLDPSPLLRFLRKLRSNPSASAQRELLLFCEANRFMIHEDGDLLAYKSVRDNYTDIHSGKFENRVGAVHSMDRGKVDDRREITCSFGFHFAAYEYASTWAGNSIRHVMVVKINPRDVVSIPNDYNNQKARCCRYEVIAERKDFTPLPNHEVYTNRDIGTPGAQDEAPSELAVRNRVKQLIAEAVGKPVESVGMYDSLDEFDLKRSERDALIEKIADEFGIDAEGDFTQWGPETTPSDIIDDVMTALDEDKDDLGLGFGRDSDDEDEDKWGW